MYAPYSISSCTLCICLFPADTSSTDSVPAAAVVGAAVGGGAVLLVLIGILVRRRLVRKSKHKAPLKGKHGAGGSHTADADGIIRVCVDDEGGLAKAMDIPGIMKGVGATS